MESKLKLEDTVNYLQFVYCALDAPQQNEEPQDMLRKKKLIYAYLYNKTKNKP